MMVYNPMLVPNVGQININHHGGGQGGHAPCLMARARRVYFTLVQ